MLLFAIEGQSKGSHDEAEFQWASSRNVDEHCLCDVMLGVRGVWPACWSDVTEGEAVRLLVLVAMEYFGSMFLQGSLERCGDLNQPVDLNQCSEY